MEATKRNESKFYLTGNILKFIAIIAMTIAHIAQGFVPYDPPSTLGTFMHMIGRTAGPIMFYFAVEGYHHTRNIKKYLSRLAVFAVVSWFPFSYFLNGGVMTTQSILQSYLYINVIYTIFLGVLAIYVRRKLKNPIAKTILILFLLILSAFADWGYWGVIIILVFDYFYGSFKKQALGYCIIALLNVILNMSILELGMFIPILLLCFYNGQRGKGGAFAKWFFYIYYPLHLLILGFLQAVL